MLLRRSLSKRRSLENNQMEDEDDFGQCMRVINGIDFDKTTLGEVVSTLLLWCFSKKDIKASVITKYLNAAFDQYHLTNYQINQLFQAHSLCNYRSYTTSSPIPPTSSTSSLPLTIPSSQINIDIKKANVVDNSSDSESDTSSSTLSPSSYSSQSQSLLNSPPPTNTKESQHHQHLFPLLPNIHFSKSPPTTNTNSHINTNNNNSNNHSVNSNNNNNNKDLYNNIFLAKLKSVKESASILSNIQSYSTKLKDDIQIMIESLDEEELEPTIIKKSTDYQTNLTKFANQILQIWPREDRNAILEVIESMILINIYELLFPFNIKKDHEIKESIRLLQKHQIDYLDIDSDRLKFVEWEQAIAELSSINVFQTPRDKVMCILRFSRIISQGLHSSGKSFGADEFVNCIVYILIKSNPAYLYSNMRYIELFRSNDLLVSESEYYFVSISSAMMFIERKYQELKNVPIDESFVESLSSSFILDHLYNSNNNTNTNTKQPLESPSNNSKPTDESSTPSATTQLNTTLPPPPIPPSPTPSLIGHEHQKNSNTNFTAFGLGESLLNDENPIHQEVIKTANEILAKLLSIAISEGTYDSRIRSALLRMSMIINHKDEDGLPFFAIEMAVGQNLFDEKERKKINRGILNVFERTTSNHRALKVAVATVTGGILLAVTGGLIAPALGALLHLIGASATVFSALTYAGVSGPTLTSLLFGTVGTVMSANRITKVTAGLSHFKLNKIHETFGLHVVLGAIGWIENDPSKTTATTGKEEKEEKDEKNKDISTWEQDLLTGVLCLGEVFSIEWENSHLYSLFESLQDYKKQIEESKHSTFTRFTTKMMHDAIGPSASILEHGSIIRTSWGIVKDRAQKAGKLLAEEILGQSFGRRPITLIGISMGARLIYHCLLALVEKKAYGIIENVIFIGAPIPSDDITVWSNIRKLVSRRLVNCFSPKDIILKICYESSRVPDDGMTAGAGYTEIGSKKHSIFNSGFFTDSKHNQDMLNKKQKYIKYIENVDVSSLIDSHLDYSKSNVRQSILHHVNINSCIECNPYVVIDDEQSQSITNSTSNNTNNNNVNSSSSTTETITNSTTTTTTNNNI